MVHLTQSSDAYESSLTVDVDTMRTIRGIQNTKDEVLSTNCLY